jgi:hypothetical protein
MPQLQASAACYKHKTVAVDVLYTYTAIQASTCTKLIQLAQSKAAAAAAEAAAAAGPSRSTDIAAQVQQLALQCCTAWVDDLAVRLAHYTCRYLSPVLAWQSGWSLPQVRSW